MTHGSAIAPLLSRLGDLLHERPRRERVAKVDAAQVTQCLALLARRRRGARGGVDGAALPREGHIGARKERVARDDGLLVERARRRRRGGAAARGRGELSGLSAPKRIRFARAFASAQSPKPPKTPPPPQPPQPPPQPPASAAVAHLTSPPQAAAPALSVGAPLRVAPSLSAPRAHASMAERVAPASPIMASFESTGSADAPPASLAPRTPKLKGPPKPKPKHLPGGCCWPQGRLRRLETLHECRSMSSTAISSRQSPHLRNCSSSTARTRPIASSIASQASGVKSSHHGVGA
mmetsp:Transcript_31692/g.86690  ORF Transcript_31692/g.86690 Transcript_31692/m.86690 type:complete len:293 (+) Transcript_31692:144-1022(+)